MRRIFAFVAVLAVFGMANLAAGEAMLPNRLAKAKVGEWAMFSMPNDYQQKHTVISRTGGGPEATVVIRVENIYDGKVINTTELTEQAGEPMVPVSSLKDKWSDIDVEWKNVVVKGKTIRATVIEVDKDDDDDVKWYVSDEIPVYGLIRQEFDDHVEHELVDYGE